MKLHSCLAVLWLAWPIGAATGAELAQQPDLAKLEVICPALRLPVFYALNGPPVDDNRPAELVFVGRAVGEPDAPNKKNGRRRSREKPVEIEVKKVLYGRTPEKTIRVARPLIYWHDEPGDFLVAAAPALYKEQPEFVARYRLPMSEERAESALCQARLDYATLSSTCIFIGKEISQDWSERPEDDHTNWRSTVEVSKVIHGIPLAAGTKLRVAEHRVVENIDYHRRACPEPRIYFTTTKDSAAGPTAIFATYTHLPFDLEPKVRDALARRNEYPVDEKEEHGRKHRYQEITYRGSNAEAIELLGARHDGAVSLAYRTLMHRRQAARGEVVAAIEREMFLLEERPIGRLGGFERLKREVDLLGNMEREGGADDLSKLVEKYLAHIEQGAADPPVLKASEWESEHRRTDVNRSLSWLMLQLGENKAREKYGERLLALRAKAADGWKQEVQVALDALKVEDTAELMAAMAPMKAVRPARSRGGLRHSKSDGIARVEFSHNGKLLATAGHGGEIRLWHTHDWSPAGVIEQEGSIECLRFSPDDRWLYVAGGGGGLQIHARFDAQTGKLDKAYEGHHDGIAAMELSPDGRSMVTASFYEKAMRFWDTDSGQILRTIPVSSGGARFLLSPDGKGIIRRVPAKGQRESRRDFDSEEVPSSWLLEPFRGDAATKVTMPKRGALCWSKADPARIYCTYQQTTQQDFLSDSVGQGHVSWGRWAADGWHPLGDQAVGKLLLKQIAIAPDGKLLAATGQHNVVCFFSLPELKLLAKVAFTEIRVEGHSVESMAFSPDGKRLVLGLGQAAPGIIDTQKFEKLWPYDGHAASGPQVFFSADGKQLRSYGEDNTVCTWDISTMKMLGRVEIPPELKVMGIRSPDGRYAICFDAALERKAFAGGGGQANPAQVFDAETGQLISQVTLPMGHFRTRIHWLDDQEALVADEHGLCRFNFREGKVLDDVKFENSGLLNGRGEITEDRKSIFMPSDGHKGLADVAFDMVDVASGKVTEYDSKKTGRRRLRAQDGGLVPGGKYFYLTDPNVYIYDRKTLQEVSRKILVGTDVLSHAFSGDGSRYALVTGGRIFVADWFKVYDPKTQSIVRVHDTESGKTLFAFPASTRWVSVKLSQDGNRVAVVNDDGTIETWTLPRRGNL